MKKICVIGDGGWGTAIALLLSSNGHRVTVWGPFAENIASIKRNACNETFLPGVTIPPSIEWTDSPSSAVQDADIIVMAVPSRYYRQVAIDFSGLILPGTPVVSATKGFDEKTGHRMTEILTEVLKTKTPVALSGPSHAEEVARGIPTAVTVACDDIAVASMIQEVFSSPTFRIYTSTDVTGVEIGGALKNVIAVAVGISDGLGFGDNTRAALITRGLVETARIGVALGAKQDTFQGLSGLGDLIVTCTSRHSRNRSVGERLGRGEILQDITDSMKQVAEGVWNCQIAEKIAKTLNVNAPITAEVYAIVHKAKSPKEAVADLLNRDMKPEHH